MLVENWLSGNDMHGQYVEDRQRNWHMWPGPSQRVSFGTEAESVCLNYLIKAGRKIGVGDCALFQADDTPFFIGFIKKLSAEKEGNLKLAVNWLYRLGDIKLGKGASFEAAPNEIFYSFHEDEISAAALLHPCKVAFLQKDVELPSSVSSFVCRRVYDAAKKCLYWLTDPDYTNEHQAEVDLLLERTKHEMQTTSLEGPSTRAISSPSLSKQETVSASLSVQGKGKKRPRMEQNPESSKREKLIKVEDSDAKREIPMRFDDFASIAGKKEGLTNVSFIEQLFQVMLQACSDDARKLVDILSRRMLLASIIAETVEEECLTRFVQLGGLRILKDWLQEAHRGKLGDGTTKGEDTALEGLLLTLIRALGKLPVDLDALKISRVGKSVNKLRSHRHPEIQKKAKDLVDMWKKLVKAEMKFSDELKTGASFAWPSKPASDGQSTKMCSSQSSAHLKPGSNGSITIAETKVILQSTMGCKEHPASVADKDGILKCLSGATTDPLPPVKEERSCSSSQSQNNSQSWGSGSVKGDGSWKDEVKPALVTSTGNKISGTTLRNHSHSTKSYSTPSLSGLPKDSLGKQKGEKSSGVSFPEKANEGARVEVGNQRLIVRLPNPGRSPSHNVSGGSLVDGNTTTNRGSPPGSLVRYDQTSESNKATLAANIGDAKGRKSNGANIKEENGKLCIAMTNDKDGRPVSSEHRAKEVIGNRHQGNVQKKTRSSSNMSSEMPALDSVQGGIDLLASVAAREVSETEKSISASPPGEGQLASTEGSRDSPGQGKVESNSRHLKDFKDGEGKNESAQAECEKVGSSIHESEQPADSPIRLSLEEKVSGDGTLVVATQLVSLGSSVSKDASPPGVSGVEGAVCEAEHRNFISRDQIESKSLCNPGGNPLMGQGRTASQSSPSSVDEGRKDSEGAPPSSVPLASAKDVDSFGCYGEDALEVARQVAKEVEQEVEMYCRSEVQDVKLVSPSRDIPSCENVHAGSAPDEAAVQLQDSKVTIIDTERAQVSASADMITESIEAATEKGTGLSSRLSNLAEVSHHERSEDIVRQCTEPAIEMVSAIREEPATSANAGREFKSSSPDTVAPSSLDNSCESKNVERPVFDLNEGFVADEVLQSNASLPNVSSSIPTLPCLDSSSGLGAQASSLKAPIAVVAASKGAFIPPSNPTRTKGELGWKGSAATSAFRPAEPRRVAETSHSPCDATAALSTSIEATSQSGKQPRFFDIDLNVADERVLEDSAAIPRLPSVTGSEQVDNPVGTSRPELDLNRVDGNDDHIILSARAGVPPTAAPRVVFDFDLNDGLGFGEEAPSQHRYPENSGLSVTGRMQQNTDSGNVAPWYSVASSMPTAMVMPAFPSNSRPESSFSVVAPPTSKPVMPMGHTLGAFSNDIYQGAAVTSSTVPYSGSMPASFSYAGFPFGTGFPFTSASYTMGSSLNSAATSPPFLTASPSQLVSAGAVISPLGRPYLMGGIRDIPGMESNASWARPSLDLNSGPEVVSDLDSRESVRPSVGLSQLSYQQAAALGGKRKEPEGSFDPFRSGFKQTAWR